MATQLNLDPLTETMIDDLMASGRFTERADVLRHGVRLAHDLENAVDEPLDAETIAAIERGIDDVEAGRVLPAEQVFEELRLRYQNWK